MKVRFISSIVGIALLLLALFLGKIPLIIGAIIVGVMALGELYSVTGLIKNTRLFITGFSAFIILMLAAALSPAWLPALLFVFGLSLFVLYMDRRHPLRLQEISLLFFLTLYITCAFGSIIFVRLGDDGQYNIWLIFICAFITDSAAMITGSKLGKRKLCPNLSPQKTIEGSLGGAIASLVAVLIFCGIVQSLADVQPDYFSAILLGILGSGFAQLGDLAASAIKRQLDIKDFGNIMPGHGGVMDRFDSVLLVAPFVYFFLLHSPLI